MRQFGPVQGIGRDLSEKDVRRRTGENLTEFDRCGCFRSNLKVANQKSRVIRGEKLKVRGDRLLGGRFKEICLNIKRS